MESVLQDLTEFGQEGVKGIVEKKGRARTPLQDTRHEVNNLMNVAPV